MSLEKIKPSSEYKAGFNSKANYIESIKKEILAQTGIVVRVKLKPPSTIVLTCGSASAASELNSQKDHLMILIKNINHSFSNLVIKI